MTRTLPALSLCALLALPAAAHQGGDHDGRIDDLEKKVDVLTEELSRTRESIGVPEEKPLESAWGLGPAASKVYGIGRGLSIGGYAEGFYSAAVSDRSGSATGASDRFDLVRAVLYTGYKFSDWLVFNAEFEFEHASTAATGAGNSPSGGSVSVEFATLDFLIHDALNVRGGLMLVPIGFLNEMHEPPFYYGNNRPEVETRIIPTTFRENGVGIFGQVADLMEYKLYAITSLNGAGFGDMGLRGGRQRGNRALAEDWSFVGAVDVTPIPELQVGASLMVGETDQNQRVVGVKLPNSVLTLWELHYQFKSHGFHHRTLFTMAHVEDARRLSDALVLSGDNPAGEGVARKMLGVYTEFAYEVLQWIAPDSGWSVEPFFRFEAVDTQNKMPNGYSADRAQDRKLYTLGVSVKPIPNVVLKLDYRNITARRSKPTDEINLGFGLVF